MKQPTKCPVCEQNTLEVRTGPGRFIIHKRMEVEVPADFPLRECSNCRARPISLKTAHELTPLLEAAYDKRLSELADQALTRLSEVHPLYEWERILGYSKGWLSKVREARKPGPQLVMLLQLLANHPARQRELSELWVASRASHVVSEVSRAIAEEPPPTPLPKVQLQLVQSGSFPNRKAA